MLSSKARAIALSDDQVWISFRSQTVGERLEAAMKYCPKCQRLYPLTQRFCLEDGGLLSLQDPYHFVGRTLLDKYRIDALVGIGGMGAVYSVHHLGIDRHVALKILQPNIALGNERTISLFE